ncbi:MAG: hypothetical protein ACTHYJ_01505, partial [Brevibacterium yomogidense]
RVEVITGKPLNATAELKKESFSTVVGIATLRRRYGGDLHPPLASAAQTTAHSYLRRSYPLYSTSS